MPNTVHKKMDELVLWEEVSKPGPKQVKPKKARPKQSAQGKAKRPEQIRTIQTIPIKENAERLNTVRTAEPKQGRPPQSRSSQDRPRPVSAQSIERRRARKRRAYIYRTWAIIMVILCMVFVAILADFVYRFVREWKRQQTIPVTEPTVISELDKSDKSGIEAPEILTDFLEINDYSRPGTELKTIESIFVHYTANPGTSAAQNRSYFANLAQTQERSASAHFIIGYEGEIIQCIPLDEEAYAVMTRNEDSISIECCYLDENGKFTQETYDSLIHLLAWLMQEYHLDSSDILRHYDCGGKLCPLYYVDHEDDWERLLADVEAYERNY